LHLTSELQVNGSEMYGSENNTKVKDVLFGHLQSKFGNQFSVKQLKGLSLCYGINEYNGMQLLFIVFMKVVEGFSMMNSLRELLLWRKTKLMLGSVNSEISYIMIERKLPLHLLKGKGGLA
jgi:hypothetical protein